jgi:uncharacterized membrane protein
MLKWLSVVQWLLVGAMFVAAVVVWPVAPDTIAVHWSLTGRPDGYAAKSVGLFFVPVIALLVQAGLKLLPRIDPNRARYVEFASAYAIASVAIVAFLAAIQAVVLAIALGRTLNVGLIVAPLAGVLLMVLGAVMGEVKPNWFFGIRTPWTLSSERSWTATHRAGRWVLGAMGLAIALAGVLQTTWALYAALVLCLAGTLGLVVYSFIVWRDDPQRRYARYP